jgi:hypothetical protein
MNEFDSSKNNITEHEINLKELINNIKGWIKFLISKWVIILSVGVVFSSIGFVNAYMQKPIYIASLTYVLEDEKSSGGISGALGLASSFGIDLGSSASGAFGATNLMELMHTRALIEKTLLSTIEYKSQKTNLLEYYISINNLQNTWNKKEELKGLKFPINAKRTEFTRVQDSILGDIAFSIEKSQLLIYQKDKKVSFSTIEVKSADELFAKLFCENLIKEVTSFYIETKSKKAKMNVSILEKQCDSIRAELNSAITGVAIANDNTYNLNPSLNVNRTPASKRQVDVQANSAILTQLVANLEMAKVTLRKETPLVQIIDSPILPLKKEKPSKLKYLVIGGLIGAFVAMIILIVRVSYLNIIS